MHASPAVVLGCTDCHGGDAAVRWQGGAVETTAAYAAARDAAHVLPRFPEDWHYPASANPERSYTLLNREAPEFIRFVNPSDYRVVREACGACHLKTILAAERSLMSTIAMFWGGAAYNNGMLPFKNYILGEAYTREGEAAILEGAPASAEDRASVRHHRATLPAAALAEPEARGHLPRVRGRRPQPLEPVPGNRPAERHGPDPAARGTGPARHPPEQPRPRHRRAHRRARAQHPQDAAQRPAHVVPRHQRPARRLPLLRLQRLPRGLRQRPRPEALGRAMRSSATAARRRPRTRRSRAMRPGIRSRTRSRARSRPASAWSATCTSRTCS